MTMRARPEPPARVTKRSRIASGMAPPPTIRRLPRPEGDTVGGAAAADGTGAPCTHPIATRAGPRTPRASRTFTPLPPCDFRSRTPENRRRDSHRRIVEHGVPLGFYRVDSLATGGSISATLFEPIL